MSSINVNSTDLLDRAYKQGFVSPEAYAIVKKFVGRVMDKALAIDQELLDAKKFDPLVFLIDDSGSISTIKNDAGVVIGPEAVCEGHTQSVKAFLGSQAAHHEGVVVLTQLMNSDQPLQPLTSLTDPNLSLLANGSTYHANGGTPLYDKAGFVMSLLILFRVLINELTNAKTGGSLMILSDGRDEASTMLGASDVAVLVRELTGASGKDDTGAGNGTGVAFMGIEGANAPDFRSIAKAMGINDKCVFVTSSDPKSIRNTFGKMSDNALSDII